MTCPSCSSPMAPDQRYCLTCGARGAEARLPFLDALRPGEAQLVPHGTYLPAMSYAAPLPPPVGVGWPDRLRANSGLLAGLAVLLLALLVGVAIGAGISNDPPQAAAAPATQVIRIEGGAAAPAAVAASPTATDATATDASATTSKAKKSAKAAAAAKAPVRSTNNAVKNLDKLTGAAAVKAADKLGKTVVVGGKAPKKDKKPAAAGGAFQEIG